jgi:K+-transporting ATPase KdpF subunit
MSFIEIVGGTTVVLLLIYLVAALLNPEDFS